MRITRALMVTTLSLAVLTVGCDALTRPSAETTEADLASRSGPDVLNVEAGHHEFVTSAEEIGSGWTTIRFKNRSHSPHFLLLERMPAPGGDQKTAADLTAEVLPVFQNVMDAIAGRTLTFPEEPASFTALPAWVFQIEFLGGTGLTSPGETSEVRLDLAPGTYVIECYVKTEDGLFHSADGMLADLTVSGDSNGADVPPRTAARVAVSSDDGITMNGSIDRPGVHTIEVRFDDQTTYAHGQGHDVHLVRLHPGADLDELETWMNWTIPGSLAGAAPDGFTFIGGSQDMPGESTAYVRALFTEGEYAWIAEVPDPDAKGMLVTFTVP